jgi:hypothetical protein
LNELNPDGSVAPRRVFLIGGDWVGVHVFGCYHEGSSDGDAPDHAVWEIESTAKVSQSCDMFNNWDNVTFVTGANASLLPTVTSESSYGLALKAGAIRVTATKIGFFGATPVARGPKYTVGPDYNRNLSTGTVYGVLGALLRDLASIGLIECDIVPLTPR